MIVQDLKQLHGSSAVAAIFIKAESSGTPEEFAIDVLESIYCQLTGKRAGNDIELQSSEYKIQGLRDSLYTVLHSIPRAFLVIDDLDNCGYQAVKAIEKELGILQEYRLRTMITSRIARYPTVRWSCDAGGGHSIRADCDVWVCSDCYQAAEELDGKDKEDVLDDLFATCTSCKEEVDKERSCYKYVSHTLNANFEADPVELVPTSHPLNCAVPIIMRSSI